MESMIPLHGDRDVACELRSGGFKRILAIENQNWIDHQMPLRLLHFDLLSYAGQAGVLWKQHAVREEAFNGEVKALFALPIIAKRKRNLGDL